MNALEYKEYKGLRKESLRDNMSDLEITLADLGELAKEHKPYGLEQNIKRIAKMGGSAAKAACDNIEKNLEKSIISDKNLLDYQYIKDNSKIENK